MLTDWVLIHRLAHELEDRLRGARVGDAGLLADGRIAILFRRRGEGVLLAIDLFSSPPLVTLEEGELGIGVEPGFVRTLARSLQGTILRSMSARRNDRLLRLSFASRSAFGVGEELELYLELVPRFGNVVLVKDGSVIAALKEFGLSENPRRAVQSGAPYLLPPIPVRAAAFPPVNDEDAIGQPLFVYRRGGKLVQAYLVSLEGFQDAELSREDSILQIFSDLRLQQASRSGEQRIVARRRALIKRLDDRGRKLRTELASVSEKLGRAEERHALRTEGESIFASLHLVEEPERDAAKERAARIFAEYKKLAKSIPHLQTRERVLRGSLEAVETLRWEAERAGDEDLEAVETTVAELGPKRRALETRRVATHKRPLLELRTARGSRIVVGRSPIENADLTFRVARPNDLWFHAARIPGAHVILARDDRTTAPDEDLALAASLAAFYSRAKSSSSVPVDYTLRKHVRKQRAAPPGLVWYTHAKTIVAEPRSLDSLR